MISKDDVKKLAKLARIKLTEHEEEKFQEDLEHILAYVDRLRSVETGFVEGVARVNPETNVMRSDSDEVKLNSDPDFLIESAPQKDGRYIKVKSVF